MKADAENVNVPERMCVGCRQKGNKSEFVRIVNNNGSIIVDSSSKAAGRGAYIHKSSACLKTAIKKKSLDRALKGRVEEEIYELLERKCND
ncbi:MAG: YlxR family protein [Oscillospiraceae bacterium]|nr:YlxR family protein [Oscillospiraceae bacterium]